MLIDPAFVPATRSLLGRQHFQTAYVTNDLAHAAEILARRYGVTQFHYVRDVPLPNGKMDIALAWAGNINLEIIEGSGDSTSFYQRDLDPCAFGLKFHHLGYLVPNVAGWNSLVDTIAEQQMEVVHSGSDPSGVDFIYIGAPDMGHYLEFIWPQQPWIDLFESLPRS